MILPSTAIIHVCGRLFGTSLGTLFEKNTLKPSALQQPFRDTLSQVQSSFIEGFCRAVGKDLSALQAELYILKHPSCDLLPFERIKLKMNIM
jgi:hypothetical protein